MAVQITSENFEEYFLTALNNHADALEQAEASGCEIVTDIESIKTILSLPGVKFSADPTQNAGATAQAYVQIPYSILAAALQRMNDRAADLQTAIGTADADHQRAESDHQASATATAEAENVDASISGTVFTVRDRNGDTVSINVGFGIEETYSSIAAMNADAGRIATGKLVIIATTDPTSEDNAKLFVKRSSGDFKFLSDLDQAATRAFAEWLNNYKPQIEQAVNVANSAATQASNTNTAVSQAEALRVAAEQDRRDAEDIRKANENDRKAAEALREGAERRRVTTFNTNEAARHDTFVTNEAQRQGTFTDNETQRQGTFSANETRRQGDFETAQAVRNTAWTDWFSDTLATGVRKLWNDFTASASAWYSGVQTAWTTWFGADNTSGVQKAWADLAADATADHAQAGRDHTRADAIAAHPPVVGENMHWWIYNAATGEYEDSGKRAQMGVMLFDFDYDYDSGELIMEYTEQENDALIPDMFVFADGDLIINADVSLD